MLGHSSQSCSRAKAHAIAHAKLSQGELELDNWGNPLPNASEATKAYVAKTKEEMKANGTVQALIDKYGVTGRLTVAPPA